MMPANASSLWFISRAALGLVLVYCVQFAARWLHCGYKRRKQVKILEAQGVPTLPHSWIFGHLIFLGKFRDEHPLDSNGYNMHYWFLDNVERFFPGEKTIPSIIYLDLWPVVNSMILCTDPAVSSQFTQAKSLPKASKQISVSFSTLSGMFLISNTTSFRPTKCEVGRTCSWKFAKMSL